MCLRLADGTPCRNERHRHNRPPQTHLCEVFDNEARRKESAQDVDVEIIHLFDGAIGFHAQAALERSLRSHFKAAIAEEHSLVRCRQSVAAFVYREETTFAEV